MSKSNKLGAINRRRMMGATAAAVGAGSALAAPAIAQGSKRQVMIWVTSSARTTTSSIAS